jgi:hypothetical protein
MSRLFRNLSKYFIELVLAISGLLAIIQVFKKADLPATLGLTVFLAGVVAAIYRIRTATDEAQLQLKNLHEAIGKLNNQVTSLVIDQDSAYLRRTLTLIERAKEPHLYAGHEVATTVYEYARLLVSDLKRHRAREAKTVQIDEKYVINDLIASVASALPKDSYWLGITHLTTGWSSESDPGFQELVRTMNTRSKSGELTILRLYCTETLKELVPIKPDLDSAASAGIRIRILAGRDRPSDMSLLWGPIPDSVNLVNKPEPASELDRNSAICGMRFGTRGGRSLDRLTLCSPDSDEFRHWVLEFDRYWRRGTDYHPDLLKGDSA